MKPRRLAIALAIGLVLFAVSPRLSGQADVAIQHVTYAAARLQATWSISATRLEAQPIWQPEDGAPPCSASTAARTALGRIRDRFPEIKGWVIHAISLHNIQKGVGKIRDHNYPDRWFYSVEIAPDSDRDTALLNAKKHLLVTVILLDGSVIEPSFAPMYDAQ